MRTLCCRHWVLCLRYHYIKQSLTCVCVCLCLVCFKDANLALEGSNDAALFDQGPAELMFTLTSGASFTFEQLCVISTANVVRLIITDTSGAETDMKVGACHCVRVCTETNIYMVPLTFQGHVALLTHAKQQLSVTAFIYLQLAGYVYIVHM